MKQKPKVESFGLLLPVYGNRTVKLPVQNLNQAKLPGICPHCLEPGDITETFTITLTRNLGFQKQVQTIGVPISTHRKCSQGFTKRNISGSIKVWSEGGDDGIGGNQGFLQLLATLEREGGRICFTFKDAWYALMFTRINFPLLLDDGGRPLLAIYDTKLSSYQSGARHRFSRKCPRCACGIQLITVTCPSCNLDLTGNVKRFQSISVETVDVQNKLDSIVGVARKCPECGIIMRKDKKVKNCARCGTKLTD
ncbi:MAG: hypothetical protein ACTSYJ_03185 [Candidatus Thorarchaeota archaeon]